MNDGYYYSAWDISVRTWLYTSLALSTGSLVVILFTNPEAWFAFMLVFIASVILSAPVLFLLTIVTKWIQSFNASTVTKIKYFVTSCFFFTLLYGIAAILFLFIVDDSGDIMLIGGGVALSLFICTLIATAMTHKQLNGYFTDTTINFSHTQSTKMETTPTPESNSNKLFFKGLITAGLILVMMIPTVFFINLVKEREGRQKEVAREVSSKWAVSQTLSGPFIYVPYKYIATDADNKPFEVSEYFWILPDNLNVSGTVDHQVRPRSIYKVLLYKTNIHNTGNFIISVPKEVDTNRIQWSEARICFGLSDFKGIEEKVMLKFNGTDIELSPGLPKPDITETGLSAPVDLSAASLNANITFDATLKIKGSERLHFIPLAGNSSFTLQSKWPSPSFDGNNLPSERNVSDSGFDAKWVFNKANLPFSTVLNKTKFDANTLAFGVTMIQPADQYAKTERTVKYAFLIIGLTLSLFFIVEIMQKKPVHPVQYVLIGLALVIFYTLLLSISEFVFFDIAYLIAAVATITLVTLYAKSHFRNWKAAGVFAGILSLLYGFIFVLIRLEDTALLIGSIGLFIILAIAMYASRKVNWYGTPAVRESI